MAVTSPAYYKGKFIGHMETSYADLILSTREQKCIPNLKKMIFNFPNDLVLRSLEEQRSIRSIIKEENLNPNDYVSELRDYQTVGTAFMYLSPRSILGDGVGLGKTVEVAALLNYLRQTNQMTRFLIAVENSAWSQVTAELTRFTGMRVVSVPSEAAKLNKAIRKVDWHTVDGLVIKHSALRSDAFSKWLALNLNDDGTCKIFDTFILDESSVIKNQGTKTYDYTKNICNISKRVHFLNATTFETNIMDIYYQVDMMNEALLPKKWRIEKEFCTFGTSTYWTKVGGKPKMNFRRDLTGYKNQDEFKKSLGLVYFGRCKADIGFDMPHIHKVYEVEPNNDQAIALNKGYRYMEVLNCPSLIPELKLPTDRKHVPKLDRMLQLIENEFNDQSIMIYVFHNDAQEKIKEELEKIGRKPVVLNGACKDADREAAVNGFNSGKYDVIITNIKKSLNLHRGDVCIFYSVLTNPSAVFQTAGRIDRNVDDRVKTYILLLYKGTDEYNFFTNTVKQRAKDARDLTIDAKTTVDYFIESMIEDELITE
ncbi:MAG: hypothetical protein IJ593_01230 [Lachnospiraceae bacterium]|nr:hypothetical protein [Lachnospiraceae bacterium]